MIDDESENIAEELALNVEPVNSYLNCYITFY
jgi:hypothetical protein